MVVDEPHRTPVSELKKCFTPELRETYMIGEYSQLRQVVSELLQGVYVCPSPTDGFKKWSGVLFMRSGLYRKGVFHFDIHFPQNYPLECPTVQFRTPVFHPQVDERGWVDVRDPYRRGKVMQENLVLLILLHLKRIFFKIDTVTMVRNKQAANVYVKDQEEYKRRVKECVEVAQVAALQIACTHEVSDDSAEVFAKRLENNEFFEEVKQSMINTRELTTDRWVLHGLPELQAICASA